MHHEQHEERQTRQANESCHCRAACSQDIKKGKAGLAHGERGADRFRAVLVGANLSIGEYYAENFSKHPEQP